VIHVVAEISLHPGARESFLQAFRELEPIVRAEDGCIEYGGTVEIQTAIGAQTPPREDVVTVIEKWASESALAVHLEAGHMSAHRERTQALTSGTVIRVLRSL
jgi:quinol monooxygenase YgiN